MAVEDRSEFWRGRRPGQLSALMPDGRRRDLVNAIRRARENLPGDPAFGDPLSVSGPGGVRAVARVADRLSGDSPSAAKELGLGALQVWQALTQRVGRNHDAAREVTIMFTDLVAFSHWSLTVGDEITLLLLRRVAAAIEPPIAECGGRVVKRMGDGIMAVFPSGDGGVRAAVAGARNLGSIDLAGYRPRMRIGLHTGSPRAIGGDWLGIDVNVAARVMESGGNGNTMISGATLDTLRAATLGELGCRLSSYHPASLRGVPADLRIYRLENQLAIPNSVG